MDLSVFIVSSRSVPSRPVNRLLVGWYSILDGRRNAKILAQAVAGDVPDAPTSISVTAAAAAGGKTRPRRAADPSLVSEARR